MTAAEQREQMLREREITRARCAASLIAVPERPARAHVSSPPALIVWANAR